MAFTSGPIAAVSAFFLVLSESSTLTTVISKNFLIQDALIDTFDGTLVSRGQDTTNLVGQGRQITSGSDPISKLGRLMKKPFERYTPSALIRYLMYLPLNFIPVIGTIMFVVVQGRKAGPGLHERYFQLKGWRGEQRRKHVESLRGAYTGYVLLPFPVNVGGQLNISQTRGGGSTVGAGSCGKYTVRFHQQCWSGFMGCRSGEGRGEPGRHQSKAQGTGPTSSVIVWNLEHLPPR